MMLTAGVAGFATGFSLILAIGAQNAFVLRQGLVGRHVFWVCLACALSDTVLIAAGVAGMGALVAELPTLERTIRWAGAAFLIVYGALRLRAAMRPQRLTAASDAARSLGSAIGTVMALTWLNPHVYIDTVALIGALSTAYEGADLIAYGAGASLASFVFFFAVGYGARLLAPVFARPEAWQILDIGIAIIMWTIAAGLVLL